MEVFVGPTFGIDVSSPPAYVIDPAQEKHSVASCLFLKEDGAGSEICVPNKPQSADESSDSSSSIGAPDDSDDEGASSQGDADEVQSRFRGGSLSTLDSIEEALPIKRGLSNHFSGKCKSFTNLAEVSAVTDLKKKENPLNKRRRLLIASKWSRKSFYSWANPKSMPLLTLNEDNEQQFQGKSSMEDKDKEHDSHDDDDDDNEDESCGFRQGRLSKLRDRKLDSFKIRSCFSLADLQEHKES